MTPAAGVLYPFFGVLLSPMIAAAAMSLSSVSFGRRDGGHAFSPDRRDGEQHRGA